MKFLIKTRLTRLCFLLCLAVAHQPLWANVRSRDGIGGGNHISAKDFDFSMSWPASWDLLEGSSDELVASAKTKTRSSETPANIWRMSNEVVAGPGAASWMQVEFISSLRVDSMATLGSYVQTTYPDQAFAEYQDGQLVGWQSKETPESPGSAATLGHLYFFMDVNMVVGVHWRRDPAQGGAQGVSNMLLSMDRATAGPKIKSIQFIPADVKPGDRVCASIVVDDLKSSFTTKGLNRLEFRGVARLNKITDVRWDEANHGFQVCFPLPSNIVSGDDLFVTDLEIENERNHDVYCHFNTPNIKLECRSYGNNDHYFLDQVLPTIHNPTPDLAPPAVDDISYDEATATLRIQAHDTSGIAYGAARILKIPGGSTDLAITPWTKQDGVYDVNLSKVATNGTRRISEVLFVDKNGLSGGLVDCHSLAAMRNTPECQANVRPEFYWYCDDSLTAQPLDKKCHPTTLKVIEFFHTVRNMSR